MSQAAQTLLHADGAAAWDISQEVLDFIAAHVTPGMATLETGAGQSTLAFLAAGARHEAVTPSEIEAEAITKEAIGRGLDHGQLTFRIGYSQDVLPKLEGDLDFVLIDGGHGFPIPATDWLYLAPRLKVGGVMMLDDVDLWTGQMLVDFMKQEACWEQIALLRGRTAAFRLVSEFELHEWTKQPFVVQKSRWSQTRRKVVNLLGLIAKGNLSAIRHKLANERRLADAAKDDY